MLYACYAKQRSFFGALSGRAKPKVLVLPRSCVWGPSALGEAIRRVTVHVASRFIDAPRAPGDRSNCHRHPLRAGAARASHELQLPGMMIFFPTLPPPWRAQ